MPAISVGSVSGQGCGCPECVRYCSGWCSAELTGANYNSDLCPACELRADEEDAREMDASGAYRKCQDCGSLLIGGECDSCWAENRAAGEVDAWIDAQGDR